MISWSTSKGQLDTSENLTFFVELTKIMSSKDFVDWVILVGFSIIWVKPRGSTISELKNGILFPVF